MRIGASRLDAASGNKRELQERGREYRAARGDDVIAVQQHGGADADGDATDRRHQRLWLCASALRNSTYRPQAAALRRLEKLGDVRCRRRKRRAAGEHDAADRIVRLRLAQRPRHRGIHRLRERVLLFRTVHPDNADAAISATATGSGMVSSSVAVPAGQTLPTGRRC